MKNLFLFFLLLFASFQVISQTAPYHTTNGTTNNEVAYGVVMLSDTTTITVGYAETNGIPHFLLMRLSSTGNPLWTQTINLPSTGRAIMATSDGNFVACGYVENSGNKDVLILKFNENGNILWSKSLSSSANQSEEDAFALVEADKAGGGKQYAITGYSTRLDVNKDVFLALVNEDGSLISQHIYQSSATDWARGINYDDIEDLFIIAGENNASGTRDALMLVVQEDGTLINSFAFDGGADDWLNTAEPKYHQANISGNTLHYYWMAGGTTSYGAGDVDMLFLRPDTTGSHYNFSFPRVLGNTDGDDELFSLLHSTNFIGSYAAGYMTNSNSYRYAMAFPVDGGFNMEGGISIGKCGYNQAIYSASKLNRNIIAWAGSTTLGNGSLNAYSLQNTDNWGISVGCETVNTFVNQSSVSITTIDLSNQLISITNSTSLIWIDQMVSLSDPLLSNTNVCDGFGCASFSIDLGADVSLCGVPSATLKAPTGSCRTYLWSTGATSDSIVVSAAGSYWVEVTEGSCTARDTVLVTVPSFDGGGNSDVSKNSYTWYFGNNAGITFSTDPPSALLDGEISTAEGSAVVSNANGQLLFYTEGSKVWNKNHAVMPNGSGLQGHWSATQSAIVVPNPADENRYYIFTIPAKDGNGPNVGLRYSEVDMTLDGGNGDVTAKNILLASPSTEKVTAVRHANGIDYWVIGHNWGGNTFWAFLVTAAGVQTTAITSQVGQNHGPSGINYLGYMKASPDASKLAVALGDRGIELLDFNNATGLVSNARTLTSVGNRNYGVEFSPNSQFLYATAYNNNQVRQFDVSSGDEATINASAVDFSSSGPKNGMQLGPDGKIYVVERQIGSLSVIHNPNEQGSAANFEEFAISLGGRTGMRGLPTFIQTSLVASYCPSATINASSTEINCNQQPILTTPFLACHTYQWLKDSQPIANATDTAFIPTASGNYQVIASYTGCSDTSSIITITNQTQNLTFDLGANQVHCTGDTVVLATGKTGFMHLWSDNSTGETLTLSSDVAASFQVSVEVFDGACSHADTVLIEFLLQPTAQLGEDTTLCLGESVDLKVASQHADYEWVTGSIDSILTVSTSGDYWVKVSNGQCIAYDTVRVDFIQQPVVSLGSDRNVCQGTPIVLDAMNTGNDFLWSDNSTNQILMYPSLSVLTDTIWVQVGAGSCIVRDSVIVEVLNSPTIGFRPDTTRCEGDSITLSVSNLNTTYLWSTMATDSFLTITTAGLYWLEADNGSCSIRDSIQVSFTPRPDVDLGTDQTICLNDSLQLDAQNSGYNYLWSTNSTEQTIAFQPTSTGHHEVWVRVSISGCEDSDTIVVNALAIPNPDLGNDQNICDGDTLVLSVGSFVSYNWSTGSQSSEITISPSQSTQYTIEVSNNEGCKNSDSLTITVNQVPSIDLGDDLSFCSNAIPIKTAPSGFMSYTWLVNQQVISTSNQAMSIALDQVGTYQLQVTDQQGCKAEDSVLVTAIFAIPQPNLPDSVSIDCISESIQLNPGDFDSYQWSTGSDLSELIVEQSGIYTVTVTNGADCVASDTVVIHDSCDFQITFPNAFSPDNNGLNDLFFPKASRIQRYELLIMNRWGTVIFRTNDYTQGWDGMYKKQPMPVGVYPFKAVYTGKKDGKEVTDVVNGVVMLLR